MLNVDSCKVSNRGIPPSPGREHGHRGVHPATLLPSNGGDGPLPLSVTREWGRNWGGGVGLNQEGVWIVLVGPGGMRSVV